MKTPTATAFCMLVLATAATVTAAATAVTAATTAAAAAHPRLSRRGGVRVQPHLNADILGNGTFDQLLDHNNASRGTFKQRYWWDAQYWDGPGSPVFLFNTGENAADNFLGYLQNQTMPGLYAQQFIGLVILIEHRYWGGSIPFDVLTAETLQFHDLPNAISDMTYFASNVKLEFDSSDGGANADHAPWVLIGGSYSGALAAWVQQRAPGVFWAYHASSAVVETITHFWQYYTPIEQALPRNCSSDIRAVVGHVDGVLAGGSESDVANLKDLFGLGQLAHHADFAEMIATPLGQWQGNQADVMAFCDFLETGGQGGANSSSSNNSSDGVGLTVALARYASWVNQTLAGGCTIYNCDTYSNPAAFNTPDDLTHGRQWDWLLCHNPFSWWQTGPSLSDGTNIVSAFNTVSHWTRQCPLKFPRTNGLASGMEDGFTAEYLDTYTGGWDGRFERVLFVNGQLDPWRSATVSSDHRPGGPLASTAATPVFVLENGVHCPEMVVGDTAESADVYDAIFDVMGRWLDEWPRPQG